MTSQVKNAVAKVVAAVVDYNAYKAAIYLNDKLVVRVSRRLYKKRLPHQNSKTEELLVVIGKPNYEQREFIKKCKKAGEPFPVKKIQFKFPPKRK